MIDFLPRVKKSELLHAMLDVLLDEIDALSSNKLTSGQQQRHSGRQGPLSSKAGLKMDSVLEDQWFVRGAFEVNVARRRVRYRDCLFRILDNPPRAVWVLRLGIERFKQCDLLNRYDTSSMEHLLVLLWMSRRQARTCAATIRRLCSKQFCG